MFDGPSCCHGQCVVQGPSLGDYKFEVLLESYSNPAHRLADGSCCDSFYNYELECLRVVCKNVFIFCVRPYNYLANTSLCPSSGTNYTTSVIASDNILFRKRRLLDSITNTSNPLAFYGSVWPVSKLITLRLVLQVQVEVVYY